MGENPQVCISLTGSPSIDEVVNQIDLLVNKYRKKIWKKFYWK